MTFHHPTSHNPRLPLYVDRERMEMRMQGQCVYAVILAGAAGEAVGVGSANELRDRLVWNHDASRATLPLTREIWYR
jgi:hypothetical protein